MEVGDSNAMYSNEYIENLAEPRMRSRSTEMKLTPELPTNSLPTWDSLPLDHKLPMISGPKGTVKLFTTKLGERVSD